MTFPAVEGVAEAEAAELLDPPTSDEEHPEDPKCPADNHKCKDCGSTNDLVCVKPDGGCACDKEEEEKCPTGDDQPKCTDEKCKGGDDNKCTLEHKGCECTPKECPIGDDQPKCSDEKCKGDDDDKCTLDHKGCECTPDEKCPTGVATLLCEKCGDKDDDGKCKGVSNDTCSCYHSPNLLASKLANENNKWKGCPCLTFVEPSQPYTPMTDAERQKIFKIWAGLPPFTKDDYEKDPNDKDPVCAKDHWPAPKLDADASKGVTSVTSAIKSWCADMNGKKLKEGYLEEWKKWDVSTLNSYWLAARWWEDSKDDDCKDEREITDDECTEVLTNIMDFCNHREDDDKNTNGGIFWGTCLEYVSVDTVPFSILCFLPLT